MVLQDRFEPAGQDVVSEEIDGEVVIVNLNNGNYYSLAQSAAVIWAGIQEGMTLEQIRNRLHLRYTGETGVMDQGLTDLIQALEAERLIARQTGSEVESSIQAAEEEVLVDHQKEAFLPPVFERFTDMKDLLLLDPVHEAEDDKGWPHAKENA